MMRYSTIATMSVRVGQPAGSDEATAHCHCRDNWFVAQHLRGELAALGHTVVGLARTAQFRFEWQFAVGAVVALIHDAVTTIGVFVLFGLEFNLTTIAAILTIIGYSINDTVVIYDRVRENLRRFKAMPLADLIDRSINETRARTVMTSLTTLLALIALVVFGGPVLRDFTIAMIWGVVAGTYSTIYVASPIILHLKLRREKVEGGHSAPRSALTSPGRRLRFSMLQRPA
jgi:preprotein translocase SecF subunit